MSTPGDLTHRGRERIGRPPVTHSDVNYDPFDFEIDADPYPVWKRMREEAPLYRNDEHGFFALSRWEDVESGLKNAALFSSSHGTLLELLQADIEMPAGMVIFDDPPSHTVYRGLMSRVFTPRKMNAIEGQVRQFCSDSLDQLRGESRFDIIEHLGATMPMRVIGMLLGIPESDQQAIRDQTDQSLRMTESGAAGAKTFDTLNAAAVEGNFGEYLDWRAENPSDDLMTQLLQSEFEDHHGVTRKLTRDEVLMWITLISGAGNETTTKLIGHTMRSLAMYPEQRARIAADRELIPQTIEEILRFEAPSPVQARYVTADVEYYGTTVPEGSFMLLVNGSANRDHRKWGDDADDLNIDRRLDHHLSFGYGVHFCLGAALARLEGRVALDEVLTRFPEWTIDESESERSHTSTVRGWDKLTVVLD